MSRTLYTIGHSDHELDALIALLQRHRVTAVADVRSQPYSRLHPQFNREILAGGLERAGIQYAFLGRELGARRAERQCYRDGQAAYDLIRELPVFQEGLARVRRGLESHSAALLCAERDPITCHRAILVCRALLCGEALRAAAPIDVQHIWEDGALETHAEAEERLLAAVGLPSAHLFMTRDELIEQAYDLQAGKIAYRESEESSAAGDAA